MFDRRILEIFFHTHAPFCLRSVSFGVAMKRHAFWYIAYRSNVGFERLLQRQKNSAFVFLD